MDIDQSRRSGKEPSSESRAQTPVMVERRRPTPMRLSIILGAIGTIVLSIVLIVAPEMIVNRWGTHDITPADSIVEPAMPVPGHVEEPITSRVTQRVPQEEYDRAREKVWDAIGMSDFQGEAVISVIGSAYRVDEIRDRVWRAFEGQRARNGNPLIVFEPWAVHSSASPGLNPGQGWVMVYGASGLGGGELDELQEALLGIGIETHRKQFTIQSPIQCPD